MQLKWFVLTWISLISGSTWAQADSVTPRAIVSLGYGFGSPIDQLKNRYGSFGMLHVATIYRSRKWEIGPSINYFFGSTVKEDVLSIYRTKEGDLIGSDHQLAQVDLRMRGIFMGITLKKLFKINPSNIICLGLQPGWLAHWIRFQDQGNTFEPILGSNRYGYDRMSAGLGLTQSLAYRYASPNRLINFEIEIGLTEACTSLRRNLQLDLPLKTFKSSSDGLFFITAKWLIPIFSRKNPDEIYY